MFGALKRGRFRSLASLILVEVVVNVVGELQPKRTLGASRGFLVAARLSCLLYRRMGARAFNSTPTVACTYLVTGSRSSYGLAAILHMMSMS